MAERRGLPTLASSSLARRRKRRPFSPPSNLGIGDQDDVFLPTDRIFFSLAGSGPASRDTLPPSLFFFLFPVDAAADDDHDSSPLCLPFCSQVRNPKKRCRILFFSSARKMRSWFSFPSPPFPFLPGGAEIFPTLPLFCLARE